MIEVTGTKQHESWAAKVFPPVEQVRPGLWSIPVPIPNNPLRYVLSYVFELDRGLAVLDTGWPVTEAWDALDSGIRQTGHTVRDVRQILITHVHPDHHGLAGQLRDESGAPIGMHALEAETLKNRAAEAAPITHDATKWLEHRGVPQPEAAEMAGPRQAIRSFLSMAQPDMLFEDGDDVLEAAGGSRWELRAVRTPGHTPGHLCYHERSLRLFLSGDHVLPRITPNISVQPGQSPDPLGDFLTALHRVGEMAKEYDVDEVLPAHEYRFRGLAERTSYLLEHHEERMTELLRLLERHPGSTTFDLAANLTWSRPWENIHNFQRRSAVGETLSHLIQLHTRGKVVNGGGDGTDAWRIA